MPATAGIAEIITPSSIVNETLRQHPETATVFNQFGIDACCGGAASISDSAIRDGADPKALLNALNLAVGAQTVDADNAA
ncbi:MAG: DUF542 domain-containing protein [Gemmatimonadaceae bacterium]